MRDDLAKLQARAKKVQKQAAKAGAADATSRAATLLEDAEKVGDVAIVAGDMGDANVDQLRAACDSLRTKAASAVVFLASQQDNRVLLLAAMTKDVVKRGVKAGDLIKTVAPTVGGKGGGRPDMAQGGGTDATKIPDAIAQARDWARAKLS
jgi:alanyl-tRNA synthetase